MENEFAIPDPADAGASKILIVEDNDVNRAYLHDLVLALGHDPHLAENGYQALESIASSIPDLVLLDIMMPGIDGYEVLRQLKSERKLRHLPVIMISAIDDLDSVVRCIESGAEDYLVKPFNTTLLRARVGACLEKKRLLDAEVHYRRQIEHEKKRADDLLHAIFPTRIAEELKETGRVKPLRHENVAVLFCDIVDFTAFCEELPPEEVIAHLQEMVSELEIIAQRHDLQKIKTIGDAFMATCGLLIRPENPVLNCVRAGVEMVQGVPRLNAAWKVRVGIHVGPVVAGVVGNRQYHFDTFGDTVNTASRIEENGAADAVNLSAAAESQCQGHFRVESLGFSPIKGKGNLEIFRVVGREGSA